MTTVTVTPLKQIQVRQVIDGVVHRHVVCPGDDLTNEDQVVIDTVNEIWTPNIIAEYQTRYNVAPLPLTKAQKITKLNSDYKAQVASINLLITNAVVVTKDSIAEASNRALLVQAQLEYNTNLGVIKNG